MKRISLVLVLLLSACANMPQIQPADADRQSRVEAGCQSHFLQGRWQLVHTINAHLYGGQQVTLTGVIVLTPADTSFHYVLKTSDGFVVFEAVDHGLVGVRRSFGPFANDNFVKRVMDDIRFLFFEPEGGFIAAGKFEDDNDGCRYQAAQHRTVDLVELPDGGWQMQQLDQFGYPLRKVTAGPPDENGISHQLSLESGRRHAYRLLMTLVEAVRLQ